MLRASEGDCLLLSYGDPLKPSHVLIDGGRKADYPRLKNKLRELARAGGFIELLVVTHIDADHIEGVLSLLNDPNPAIDIREIWFNGLDELRALEAQGPEQGDELSQLLKAAGRSVNRAFDSRPVFLRGDESDVVVLQGGLQVRLLSPTRTKLMKLREEWEEWRSKDSDTAAAEALRAELAEAKDDAERRGLELQGKRPMPAQLDIPTLAESKNAFDSEPPNGSSIAFVASWGGKSMLLTGDAHPDVLVGSIKQLSPASKLKVDLVKMPHHGSRKNISGQLIELLDCARFAISTTGSRFGHPDPEAIARVVMYTGDGDLELFFNSIHDKTEPWGRVGGRLKCHYPEGAAEECVISL